MEEVNNLLDLLYTGTAEQTSTLRDLVNMFLIDVDVKVANGDQIKHENDNLIKEDNYIIAQAHSDLEGKEISVQIKPPNLIKKSLVLTQKSKKKTKRFHKKVRENQTSKTIVCTSCGQMFESTKTFKDHNRRTHRIYKKRNIDVKTCHKKKAIVQICVCTKCGEEFSNSPHNKLNLQYHMKAKHGDPSTLLTCRHCGKVSTSKVNLNNHELLHSDPTIPCHECGKLFHTQKNLSRHILSLHTDSSELPVRCTLCSKGFIDSSVLKDHMNVHSGLKPYKCKHCCNVYQNRSNRISHEKKSHRDLHARANKPIWVKKE